MVQLYKYPVHWAANAKIGVTASPIYGNDDFHDTKRLIFVPAITEYKNTTSERARLLTMLYGTHCGESRNPK